MTEQFERESFVGLAHSISEWSDCNFDLFLIEKTPGQLYLIASEGL